MEGERVRESRGRMNVAQLSGQTNIGALGLFQDFVHGHRHVSGVVLPCYRLWLPSVENSILRQEAAHLLHSDGRGHPLYNLLAAIDRFPLLFW